MDTGDTELFTAGEIVLPCRELDDTVRFFLDRLGFRIDAIFPADDPRVAVLSGAGVRIRLERDTPGEPGTSGAAGVLRLHCPDPERVAGDSRALTAPNGTRIELARADPALVMPPWRPAFVHTRRDAPDAMDPWNVGRAGMEYRDLIPDRQGGRVIASHIRIRDGGPVPDYVHFHRIQFQAIYCLRGWVRVAYEDQGPPFVMEAGDCVLQPPRIRHRVLECSPGLEVLEVTCPAEHETRADHTLALPTPTLRRERDFDGQRFVLHRSAQAEWRPSGRRGWEARDLGIASATGGIAAMCVARTTRDAQRDAATSLADFQFAFVLRGHATLAVEGQTPAAVSEGDAFVVPPRMPNSLSGFSAAFELLEVSIPAGATAVHRGDPGRGC